LVKAITSDEDKLKAALKKEAEKVKVSKEALRSIRAKIKQKEGKKGSGKEKK